MKRGDVWWVAFPSARAGEIQKDRPAVIVSSNDANDFLNRVQVVPITTKVDKVFPSEALILVRGKKHKAMADQLTTAGKARLKNRIGRLSNPDMKKVEQAICTQLGLPP